MGQLRITLMYRWTVLCIFSLSLCHNAFSAADQGKTKVTLEVAGKTRVQVLHMLEKQVGVIFFYASHIFNTEEKISISAVDKPLDEVLEKVFDGTGMEWVYGKDKIVSVKRRKHIVTAPDPAMLDSNITSMTVRGRVISGDGTPVAGATIVVKGSNAGDVSDADGNFTVTASRNNTLLISSIGYEPREINVSGKIILAKLNLALNKLDETVIVAYGSTTKRYNTGDVNSIKGKDIASQPITNALQALQAKVPGLYITQLSGVSGGGYSVQIRGKNSINNGNEPLYIIDGVPYESTLAGSVAFGIIGQGNPLNYLDPMSIERIDVLKDADATAIYGSRGANGVILITTKSGTSGKIAFDFNARSGIGMVTNKATLLNKEQYLNMRKEAFKNDGSTPGPLDYDLNGTWDTTKSTDWQKMLIGGKSHYNDYQGTVTSGTENLNFLLGFGYHNETSVFPGKWSDNKYSVRIGVNTMSRSKKLRIAFTTSLLKDRNLQPQSDITSNIYTPPLGFKVYNDDGTLNWENSTWTNPFGVLQTRYISDMANSILSLNTSYDINKAFRIKVTSGYSFQNLDEKILTPYSAYPPIYIDYGVKNAARFNFSKIKTYNVEPQLEYKFSASKHKLNLLIGATFLQRNMSQTAVAAEDFLSDEILSNISAAGKVAPAGSQDLIYRYSAVFGRINYSLLDRYIFQFTGRRDGSSRFGPGRQFANFGAIGLAWIFTNEEIFKNGLKFISFGKIHGSYGLTGNDQIGDYQYLDLYYPLSNTYQGAPTLGAINLYNRDFAWEKNAKLEIAFDLGFWDDKLLLSTAYYRNRSSNQLVGYRLPSITGFSTVTANLPATIQNSGYEIQLTTNNLKGRKFTWNTSINLSVPKNRLIAFPDLKNSGYQYVIGQSINMMKLFKFDGVDPNTGIYKFQDSTGKQVALPNPATDRNVYVNPDPKFYGGITNSISYSGFELDFVLQFVKKIGLDPAFNSSFPGQGTVNQLSSVLNRWSEQNNISVYQKFSASNIDAANAFAFAKASDKIVTDASFARLKSLQLSYSVPLTFSSKVGASAIRIYVQGQNLLTITNYKGLDPETSNTTTLPPLKTIVFGLNARF